jgi:hypothetical protein
VEKFMATTFLNRKSDPRVLERLERAAQRKPTPSELFEQRVSFVYSAMSENGGATRERVRELVRAHEAGQQATVV